MSFNSRRYLSRCLPLATATAAVYAFASPAMPAVQTFSGSTETLNSPVSISIPAFNPSLGNLTDVSLEYSTSVRPGLQVDDLGGPANASGSSIANIAFNGPSPSYDVSLSSSTFSIVNTQVNTGFTNFSSGSIQTLSDTLEAVPSDFAMFEGISQNDSYLITPTFTGGGSINNGSASGSVDGFETGSAQVTITYIYSPAPIPEPVTSVLVLGGAAGGFASRRRKR
jgi:hypothetical protein